jgi:hypothetical protein
MVRIGRKLCRKAISYYKSLLKEAAGSYSSFVEREI